MASNRHLGRIIVLQSLYEYEFRAGAKDKTLDLDAVVAKNIEPYSKALGDVEFVYGLTRGVAEHAAELDEELAPLAPNWPISTIACVDRNILRIGLFELQYCKDQVPPKVVINEAVELAKSFGSDSSSRFVNGVLGTAYRQLYGEADNAKPSEPESAKAEKPAGEPESTTASAAPSSASSDATSASSDGPSGTPSAD